jgi:hypothetical protein
MSGELRKITFLRFINVLGITRKSFSYNLNAFVFVFQRILKHKWYGSNIKIYDRK